MNFRQNRLFSFQVKSQLQNNKHVKRLKKERGCENNCEQFQVVSQAFSVMILLAKIDPEHNIAQNNPFDRQNINLLPIISLMKSNLRETAMQVHEPFSKANVFYNILLQLLDMATTFYFV